MTVQGYLVSDEHEGMDYPNTVWAGLQMAFIDNARHTHCQTCHGNGYLHRTMTWPRNGFSEFPLDFTPPLAPVVQSV